MGTALVLTATSITNINCVEFGQVVSSDHPIVVEAKKQTAAKKDVHKMVEYLNEYKEQGSDPSITVRLESGWYRNETCCPPDKYGNTFEVKTTYGVGVLDIVPVKVVNPWGAVETIAKYYGEDIAIQKVEAVVGPIDVAVQNNVEVFDAEYYYNTYPDLQGVYSKEDIDGLYQHYITFGKAEGRRCHK